jgi:acyl-CoA synthetase (AMP-forming)/AMP-acid ligase II
VHQVTSLGPGVPWAVGALRRHGTRPALVTDDGLLTYAELADQVEQAARALGPARRLVLLEAATAVEPVVALIACLAGGHPVLLTETGQPAAALVDVYDPDVVVGPDGDVHERRAASSHQVHPDLALLLSTSGTTGSPKLVRLSGESLVANAGAIAAYLGLTAADRAITTLPLHYCYGLSVLTSHLAVGASLVLSTTSVVDPCFWSSVERHRPTSVAGVPHTFELLERADVAERDLSSFRFLTQAGGRMAPEQVRRFAALGAQRDFELFVMYGQTEATARMAYLPPPLAAVHPEAIGVPVHGGSFALDHDVAAAAELGDDVGELLYRGPNVMLGYAESPADLALGRTVEVLRTGDLARRTADGLYQVVGRASRFLKLFGLRVDLQRVEAELGADGIDAVATGDDRQLVLGVPETDDAAARAHQLVVERLGLPASAVQSVALHEVPRLASGKPDLAAVRALAASPDGTAAEPESSGLDRGVRTVLARHLGLAGPDDVRGDDSFVGLGGDSLSYVEVSLALERRLGHLPSDWHLRTVDELEAGARRPTRWARLDTTVVLRAVAILLVVSRHVGTWSLAGGAHLLLVVSGWNLARFQLSTERTGSPVRGVLSSAAKVAVPSVLWLTLVAVLTEHYGWSNALLVHDLLGFGGDARWRYWYVEAIVQVLVLVALVLLVPGIDRQDQRHPAVLPGVLVGLALALNLGPLGLDEVSPYLGHVTRVLACFGIGWLAQRVRSWPARVAASGLAVLVLPPLFPNPERDVLVTVGVLLLLWVPVVAVPRLLAGGLGALAGGSLYVYLTHWEVFPLLEGLLPPVAVVPATLLVGIAVWQVVELATRQVRALRRRPASPSRLARSADDDLVGA